MVKIAKNRFLDALLKLMLLSAVMHVSLLIVLSLFRGDISYINYFRIIDLDSIFPDITEGTLSQIVSLAIIILLYLLIFLFFTPGEHSKKTNRTE